jgi:hypothetical protein
LALFAVLKHREAFEEIAGQYAVAVLRGAGSACCDEAASFSKIGMKKLKR